jgi:hypothetical protein
LVRLSQTPSVPLDWKGLGAVVLWEAGVRRDERGLVRVPYRLAGGTVHNEKVFGRERSWWATTGLPLIPFGLERIPDIPERRQRLLWIAEGESDALCLREHYAGWRGRPVIVLGVPGAGSWREEWAAYTLGWHARYVFPDADRAGERMARRVTERGGIVVWLPPGEDVREVVQRDGPEALDHHIIEAERVALLLAAMIHADTLDGARRWLREVAL